jgi:hypothetical protein
LRKEPAKLVRKPSANRNHAVEAAAPEISCHKRRASGTVAASHGLVRQFDHELTYRVTRRKDAGPVARQRAVYRGRRDAAGGPS